MGEGVDACEVIARYLARDSFALRYQLEASLC